ncbi:MAG: phage holin family protein [Pseudomonadota bacterium]
MSEADSPRGLFGSLRQLMATALEIGHVRLQLLGNELEQEKLRIFDGLLLAGVGLMLLSVGTVLLCGFIILLFAEGYRLAALGVLTMAFIGAGVWAMRAGGVRMRGTGHLFQATLGEIADDHSALVAPSQDRP